MNATTVNRLTKVVLSFSIGAFALLVAADNVADYETNFAFVQHVLSMDTIVPAGRLAWRGVHDPVLWTAGYGLIIVGEAVTAVLFLVGSGQLLRALRAPVRQFERAKSWTVLGAVAGFGVWFVGFMLVGGEWFQMWRSPAWDGQQAAFRFYMTILAVLIFTNQPDREIGDV